jgi:hypothetical protein
MAVNLNLNINVNGTDNASKVIKDVGDQAIRVNSAATAGTKNWQSSVTALSTGFLALKAAVETTVQMVSGFLAPAIEAEKAYNRLQVTLKASGIQATHVAEEIQNWVEYYERLSGTQAEVLTEGFNAARNAGLSVEKSLQTVRAALGTAQAKGLDFNTVMQGLIGTFEGVRGRLAKTEPELNRMSEAMMICGRLSREEI